MPQLDASPFTDPRSISTAGGAYALLVRLRRPWRHGISSLGDCRLQPGLYVYCGSAYGPGGLRARIARHLRRSKAMRWHVDRLTAAGTVEGVAVHVGGRECDLVSAFIARGAVAAVPGFGSSDCRRCPAHLLTAPDGGSAFAGTAAAKLGPDGDAPL